MLHFLIINLIFLQDRLYLDGDLLRNMSSKLDIVLMNQRRILNEIFPGEAIIERPENCPPPHSITR